jgi:hypothetical protein
MNTKELVVIVRNKSYEWPHKPDDSLHKFKISYFYGDQGMEGRVDVGPELEIMAQDKTMAAYIYRITCGMYLETSYEEFLTKSVSEQQWGLSIVEIKPESYQQSWSVKLI